MIVNPPTQGAALSPLARPMVDQLAGEIRSGQLAAGQRLPTIRALAQQYGISYCTTQRAIAHLESIGLVETLRGSGTYVADRKVETQTLPALSNQVFLISNEIRQDYSACIHPMLVRLQAAGLVVAPLEYMVGDSRLRDLTPILEQWHAQPPRAVIVKPCYPPLIDLIERFAPPQTCLIMSYVLPSDARRRWHMVTPEYETGFYLAARHLLEQGHRRIGMVVPPLTTRLNSSTRIRNTSVAGALRAYKEAGLRRELKLHVNRQTEADPRAWGRDPANVSRLARWMTRPDGPTAFIATDHRAVCLKLAAKQAGLVIGKDFELVTYGNPAAALRGEHPCVAEPHDVIADQIVQIILEQATSAPGVVKRIIAPPRLVERRESDLIEPLLLEECTATSA